MSAEPSSAVGLDRDGRIARVVENVVLRRIRGEDASDEQVLSSYPDLLPELADELRDLRKIDNARRRAAASSAAVETLADRRSTSAPSDLPADWLPGYELQGEVHRGGQGVVYKARQVSADRIVAIKVMREGPFAGPRERARFEREVHVLGQLRHPNIVAVHDGGVSARHFYIVMDFIDGLPVDQFVRQRSERSALDAAALVRLMAGISEAVSAAHLQGIIHRDLKPGNILVDAVGEPHILDFGLAKLAAGEDSADIVTQSGQFVGSLPWASPEQARGASGTIDIRTDVYSLGVVFYQLITGRFPYDVGGPIRDVLDNIQSVPPASIARRGRDCGIADDDLCTIILKCLAKEPLRRYQSAGELARDLRRCLSGEPIEARRDNAWYVLRKQLRRHRRTAAVAALFFIVLIGAATASSILWRRAEHQKVLAQAERNNARDSERLAERQAAEARRESAKAAKVMDFLQTMLTSVEPAQARGRDVTVKSLLKQASRRASEQLGDNPDVAGTVHYTIGAAYWSLGDFKAAVPHLRKALALRRQTLGERHIDVAEAMTLLGTALKDLGEYGEAETMLRDALTLRRDLVGVDSPEAAQTMNNLAHLLFIKGDAAGSEALMREALEINRRRLGPEHYELAKIMSNLAFLHAERGAYDDAERLYGEALRIRRKQFGEEHPEVSGTLLGLAKLYFKRGDLAKAETAFRDVLSQDRRFLGADNPDTAVTMADLGSVLIAEKKDDEAEQLLRDALQIQRDRLDARHPFKAATMLDLGELLLGKARYSEAEPLLLECFEIREHVFGAKNTDTIAVARQLVKLYQAWSKPEKAALWNEKIPPPSTQSRAAPASRAGGRAGEQESGE